MKKPYRNLKPKSTEEFGKLIKKFWTNRKCTPDDGERWPRTEIPDPVLTAINLSFSIISAQLSKTEVTLITLYREEFLAWLNLRQ
jgi:hypothetical protein